MDYTHKINQLPKNLKKGDIVFVQVRPGQKNKSLFCISEVHESGKISLEEFFRKEYIFTYSHKVIPLHSLLANRRHVFSNEEDFLAWVSVSFSFEAADFIVRKAQNMDLKPTDPRKRYDHLVDGTSYFTLTHSSEKEHTMLEQIMNTNKVAAKEAATLTTTNAVNDILAAKVGEFLPENAKEFLKTPLGKLAMANAVVMLSTTFADSIGRSNARKVEVFGRSMVTSAMVETLAAFNVAELMKELAGVVDLPEFQESINKA